MWTIIQDLRIALRAHAKSPGFAIAVVLILALGIGTNAAIFSAVNGILLQPLLYADSSRLVRIQSIAHHSNSPDWVQGISFPTMQDIRAQCSAFGQMAAYSSYSGATILGGSAPDDVAAPEVSGDFFSMMGVPPLLGRAILPADTQPGNDRVVVLNYDLWKKDFGGDPNWVGRQITLNDQSNTILGVMPPEFTLGIGVHGGLWRPAVMNPQFATDRSWRESFVIARLKKNISLEEANVQLSTLAARLATAYPDKEKGWELVASSVKEDLVGSVRAGLLILLGTVALVLLIACVNIGGLLLSRGWARQKEVAIREALGATKLRILRQFVAEGLLLALAGGATGLLLSVWAIRMLRLIAPPNTPRVDHLHLNPTVLLFTLGISLFAGILFSLAPAMQTSAGWMGGGTTLKNLKGSASVFSAKRTLRLRSVLVTIEVALAMVLVVGAGLLARSFEKLITVNLGYRADHVLTAYVNASTSSCDHKNPSSCEAVIRNILDRIRSLAGVDAAAFASSSPLAGGWATSSLYVERQDSQPEDISLELRFHMVTPDYFRTLEIPFVGGRDFSESDTNNSTHIAIVNQAFARQYSSGNPLGKRISMQKDKNGHPEWMEIVGEVGDSRGHDIREKPVPQFYVPLSQSPDPFMGGALLVRTASQPLAMAAAVRAQIWTVDKNAPIDLQTMDEALAIKTAEPKFQTLLLESFGALGLVLAMIGLFGVISYSVAQRTHEIGVRMALGADSHDVLRMVTREGMFLAAAGIAIGVCGALALSRVLQSFLYEIKPTDPATFVGVAMLLAIVALAACYIPARRAMRIDPMVALRYE